MGVPVLVVEDDAASRKLTSLLLTQAGGVVQTAASAEEALVALATFKPRVIVLDLVLPRMGGLLLVELLKADERTRDIVVVAVTSLNNDARSVALRAGCTDYIRKPIDAETFASVVAKALGAAS